MLSTRSALFDAEFVQAATGGRPVGNPRGDRVITDSREDPGGALFVALSGPRFDGHDFVDAVRGGGASGVVVSEAWWETAGSGSDAIVVEDPLRALQLLAAAHRQRYDLPLAAVTGSNGKTTTKDLLAAALQPLGSILATRGNRNNHIGLPLTLLDLRPEHRGAVVEIGLNRHGELGTLAPLARPRVGVITNVAEAHLEGLGSIDGVARAKAEIVKGVVPGGALVRPLESPALDRALRGVAVRTVTFGLAPEADFAPAAVVSEGWDGSRIELPDGTRLSLRLPGDHAVANALAALAAARELGVAPARAAAGIEGVAPVPGRLCSHWAGPVRIVDDTYNANPTSLAAALGLLRDQPAALRVAILGDMLELGEDEMERHRRAGRDAAFLDRLVTVGPRARAMGQGALEAGLEAGRWKEAEDGRSAAQALVGELPPGSVVLIKGSRGCRLETAVERLLGETGN